MVESDMARILISLCLVFWAATESLAQGSVAINLGAKERIAALYSFPNNCGPVICYLNQTLEETIKKYLLASLKRDGYDRTDVKVSETAGDIIVELDGKGAKAYSALLPAYLEAGDKGIKGANEIKRGTPVPDFCPRKNDPPLWRYTWRFFMPHGVAMVNHPTVQLLHFPPSNVLMATQDYLAASTTKRWGALLERNGAPSDKIDRFQNIIDIAPIAAPHKDGCRLKGAYSHFNGYNKALLNLWLPLANQAGSRPMVAFGSHVRNWLKDVYKVDLDVLELGTVTLASGLAVPILPANHPSYIWFVKRGTKACREAGYTNFECVMETMREDLKAACWQVRMGQNPTASPQDTLSTCRQEWAEGTKEQEVCELSSRQAFNEDEAETQERCSYISFKKDDAPLQPIGRQVSKATLKAMRDEIGKFDDSALPDD